MTRVMATVICAVTVTIPVAMADPAASRTIYKCTSSEGPVFSDHPCGPSAETYRPDLTAVSVVETIATPVSSTTSRAAPPPRRPPPVGATRAQICARLDQSLHKIAATMRSGYGVKQGERLKERKREIQARRRAEKC